LKKCYTVDTKDDLILKIVETMRVKAEKTKDQVCKL